MTSINVDGHEIEVTNTDKILFRDAGITKGELIQYYQGIAGTILPHLAGRPISMERFPDGIDDEGFYQKEAPKYFPEWIHRAEIDLVEGASQDQVVCDSAGTQVFLADQGCITPHTWLSREGSLDCPDKLIIDLDPPGNEFEPVREAAFLVKDLLKEIGLSPHVMTTGSRGLHVIVPIKPVLSFDRVREIAMEMAGILEKRYPDKLTAEIRKEKRKGRLFLDVLRNAYGRPRLPLTPYAPDQGRRLQHPSNGTSSRTKRLYQKVIPLLIYSAGSARKRIHGKIFFPIASRLRMQQTNSNEFRDLHVFPVEP